MISFLLICAIFLQVISPVQFRDALKENQNILKEIHNENTLERLFKQHIPTLTIPRPPGSPNHRKVQSYLIQHFEQLHWDVTLDRFRDTTPQGEVEFTNIIATKHPHANTRIIIAAHYDSKIFPHFEFVGATDSAVPCALILDICSSLDAWLTERWSAQGNGVPEITLQVVFFDGEEAFHEWSSTDSIYGSRHLASKWETSGHLGNITTLMLLDLLGTHDTRLVSFNPETSPMFRHLFELQQTLAGLQQLQTLKQPVQGPPQKDVSKGIFSQEAFRGGVEDDHIPFQQRGVPILHLISYPFPTVWHKKEDNADALDMNTIKDLSIILKVFICDYLSLWSGNKARIAAAQEVTQAAAREPVTPTLSYEVVGLPFPFFVLFVTLVLGSIGINVFLFCKVQYGYNYR